MLLVTSIMVVLFTIVAVNFNSDRIPREVKLNADEFLTNIRKMQSASLTGKNYSKTNKTPSYYGVKFDNSTPTIYESFLVESGTYSFESLGSTTMRSGTIFDLSSVDLKNADNTVVSSSGNCLGLLFELPFGRIYMFRITSCVTAVNGTNSDITNYITNYQYPDNKITDANRQLYFRLRSATNTAIYKTIDINGQTGNVAVK